MFNPTREQVRDMFFEAWRRYRAGEMLVGIETIAVDVILAHPEYHEMLGAPQRYRERDYSNEANPFLHLSLHLAFEEQLSIGQPPGVGQAFQALAFKCHDRHDALHEALECLAETMWRAQRDGAPPDAAAYVDCLMKRARR